MLQLVCFPDTISLSVNELDSLYAQSSSVHERGCTIELFREIIVCGTVAHSYLSSRDKFP